MEQQKQEYKTPQGQVCIVTDYTRLIVENADAFPALSKRLEEIHNREWNYRMTDEAREDYKDAVEMKNTVRKTTCFFCWKRGSGRNIWTGTF